MRWEHAFGGSLASEEGFRRRFLEGGQWCESFLVYLDLRPSSSPLYY